MNYLVHKLTLDMHKAVSQAFLSVKKGDTKRKLYITLTEKGKVYFVNDECKAVFVANKHNGDALFNDCAIENGVIVYQFTDHTTEISGKMDCEIRLYDEDGTLISSPQFTIIVDGVVDVDGTVVASSEFSTLNRMIADSDEIHKNMVASEEDVNKIVANMVASENVMNNVVANMVASEEAMNKVVADSEALLDKMATDSENILKGITVASNSNGEAETLSVYDTHCDGFVDHTARAGVDGINSVVFEFEEVPLTANLWNPKTAEYREIGAGSMGYYNTIPCTESDHFWVMCNDNGNAGMLNQGASTAITLIGANGVRRGMGSSHWYNRDVGWFMENYNITDIDEIVAIEFGAYETHIPDGDPANVMVVLSATKPTEFIPYEGGKVKGDNRIDGLAKRVSASECEVHTAYGLNDNMSAVEWLSVFNECVEHCRTNGLTFVAHNLKLKADVDLTRLRGCKLTGETITAGHTITIGDSNNVYGHSWDAISYDFNIVTAPTEDNKIIVTGGTYNSRIKIAGFNGDLVLQTSDDKKAIAYNTFDIGVLNDIRVEPADGSQNALTSHWVNENTFNLQRVARFITGDIWYFDNNEINGGCFEGPYRIELNTGTCNLFRHMRFEPGGTDYAIVLGNRTSRNIIRGLTFHIKKNIEDKGRQNTILDEGVAARTMLCSDSATVETVANSVFKGATIDEENDVFYFDTPSETPFYISPFIPNPKNASFRVHSALAVDKGVCVGYHLYDENFAPIQYPAGWNKSLYLLTTDYYSVVNFTEGLYLLPDTFRPASALHQISEATNNRYINVISSGVFSDYNVTEEEKAVFDSIKYVRFYIGNLAYFGSKDTRFKSIIANCYTCDNSDRLD